MSVEYCADAIQIKLFRILPFTLVVYFFIFIYSSHFRSNNLQEKAGLREPAMVSFIVNAHFNILKDAFFINIKTFTSNMTKSSQ